MSGQKIIVCRLLPDALHEAIDELQPDKLFILCDTNTHTLCLPHIMPVLQHEMQCDGRSFYEVVVEAGDANKSLPALAHIWSELSNNGATRHSLLLCLGGGMLTDLGGFAAATFKRGMTFINIPTTLLAMVDAAVGGKTGINFNGLKNEIGAFAPAERVLIDAKLLCTLDSNNLLSGYAEMLKHGLISGEQHWSELLGFDLNSLSIDALQVLVAKSIDVKKAIVTKDPLEHGMRKALNFGHTIGHAFESMALQQGNPVLHGYAVAYGLVCELYLSYMRCSFPKDKLRQTIRFIQEHYGSFFLDCSNYDLLYNLMLHDKKNTLGCINFTLLKDIGEVELDCTASKNELFETFDFYRDAMGI